MSLCARIMPLTVHGSKRLCLGIGQLEHPSESSGDKTDFMMAIPIGLFGD
jgi:hypothetical protein